MSERIRTGDLEIAVNRKDVKNVHLSVHPPGGHVTLVAPTATRLDVARAYAISKLGWISEQQRKLEQQPRETPRQFVQRESHYVWGRRHLLSIVYEDTVPLSLLFIVAGVNQFVSPDVYLKIMPGYLPWPLALVYVSGFFDVAGGVGVAIPKLWRAAGWGSFMGGSLVGAGTGGLRFSWILQINLTGSRV
jgi:hypothetical protein